MPTEASPQRRVIHDLRQDVEAPRADVGECRRRAALVFAGDARFDQAIHVPALGARVEDWLKTKVER